MMRNLKYFIKSNVLISFIKNRIQGLVGDRESNESLDSKKLKQKKVYDFGTFEIA